MSADQTPGGQDSQDEQRHGPGPRGGIPQSMGLLFSFGLMAAGIIALVGFAIDKGDEKDQSAAIDPANVAAAELYATYDAFAPNENQLKAEQGIGVLGADASATEAEEDSGGMSSSGAVEADLSDPSTLLAAANETVGMELYFANGCSACHGNTGEGIVGPTIAQTGLTLSQVAGQYRTPRGVMPAFNADQISDQEVAHIFAWLQTQDLPSTILEGLGTP